MSDHLALRRTAALLVVAVAVAAGVVVALPGLLMPFYPPGVFGVLVRAKVFFATLVVVLLAALFVTYARLYRELPTRFTRGLLLFTAALLLYAATANPVLPLLLGFGRPRPIGPFTFLPEAFTCVAVLVLYYQSNT
ncbi:hypothetical protein MBEHAL_0266 [Halarchaeum acidiphilum MH1-52-1]|uniref:Uncharacterized protein n=1 Tax=Halarchaeum acidiphilum MH1-52-1 TaxID=1261545 RepID=U2YCZ1_9EURY|nr:hypothetical protein [Halarchaeum acidiphilum]GAD51506.1 hypothetical protein MBEHAL_0266 [Halarchaeum acidiphilum MH1-52-1]